MLNVRWTDTVKRWPRLLTVAACWLAATLVVLGTAGCDDDDAHAPKAAYPIPPVTVQNGDSVQVEVSWYFTDRDGDYLTYSSVSSNPDVTRVSVSGSTVTVRATGRGSATVTVTAADPDGLSASQEFGVTVVKSDREVLEDLYGKTGGDSWRQNDNWLTDGSVGDWFGVSVDADGYVTGLILPDNNLSGEIPPELGELTNLHTLRLSHNNLTGEIPTELGQLAQLYFLNLEYNMLTGTIPLTLADLDSLAVLNLRGNSLTGGIPPELGNLVRLEELDLSANRLTGEIPAELGELTELKRLLLGVNELTGRIPPELGNLARLEDLLLHNNDLSGPVPAAFKGIIQLRALSLTNNEKMKGALPGELTELWLLTTLKADGTGLCAPSDTDFQEWLKRRVHNRRIISCNHVPVPAYIVQQVQSLGHPVPLVEGDRALLRVFLTANKTNRADIPGVRVRFYADNREIHSQYIEGKSGPIPTELYEGDLMKSVNDTISGKVIREGLEMVIEVDSVDAGLAGRG